MNAYFMNIPGKGTKVECRDLISDHSQNIFERKTFKTGKIVHNDSGTSNVNAIF